MEWNDLIGFCSKHHSVIHKDTVRNWFSSICFAYTCLIFGSFGRFYWVISSHVFGLFWQLLFLNMFQLGRIILGLVLLFFTCSFLVIFLYYYLSYSCTILGQLHVCQLADHHLLLCLPNWTVAYSVLFGSLSCWQLCFYSLVRHYHDTGRVYNEPS